MSFAREPARRSIGRRGIITAGAGHLSKPLPAARIGHFVHALVHIRQECVNASRTDSCTRLAPYSIYGLIGCVPDRGKNRSKIP